MKTRKYFYTRISLIVSLIVVTMVSCERDPTDDAVVASFPTTAEVYVNDNFVNMGSDFYLPYADSKLTAFSIDNDEGYESNASIRIDVPNADDPEGAYAGAIFRVDGAGRDLTGYDALTFWAKASQGVTIGEIGFGEDFFENKYVATRTNVSIGTNWTKYIIPIPDASKLVEERGVLRYAAGTQGTGGSGYTFWFDEIQFEKLGTIAQPRPAILNGNHETEQSFIGASLNISGLTQTVNLASGLDQTVIAAPAYFSFTSSNPNVAMVNELGQVSIVGSGNTTITASLDGVDAEGSLTIESLGQFNSAPTPMQDPADVISIFSDAYTNVPVDFFNGFWEPFQTTQSADFQVNGDNVLSYTNFNFVGNQFANPTINASLMSHIHFDVFIPEGTAGHQLKITLRDFGANGSDGGGDDTNLENIFNSSQLVAGQWNSLDISVAGMTNRSSLGLLIYENLGSSLTNFYLDNIFLYNDGSVIPAVPTVAAPTPTQNPADVISIFSDAYTNISGIDYNPNWGQATAVSNQTIAGDDVLLYSGLNYQGTDFSGNPQDVSGKSFLHIDYYTANSSTLNVYIISPGPVETAYALTVPSSADWTSIDIPLSSFSPVDLANIVQFKFDGNGDIYLDNMYFY